jgi:hypothetical protein
MTDNDAIDAAYSAVLQNLYTVLSSSFLLAKGDTAKEQTAEEAFKQGLALARKVRERAKVLVAAK